ncbi:MAG TPA: phosphomannose isomerase type II C-terminal cupin domain [Acetobacteraceae bacterium]|jgi:mannose-6-phosphate isomerase-like protein (cupin superfamily)|nr:phosphomannose isomerase type II C-terminal cupin domain [Acetobacteraceae bacterium]
MPEAATPYAVGQHDTRPWGEWKVIDCGEGFVVKRITVRPGHRLSLQRHRHRAEQWVVVAGTASVTRADTVFTLTPGETTRIAPGEAHRIANPGADDVVFIEVQTGSHLSEDDIERLHDDYGRHAAQ